MRKKLKPDQDLNSIQKELLEEISAEYKRIGTLSGTAKVMGISLMKVRKALITSGDFSSEISEDVERMLKAGKTVSDIARTLNMTESSAYSYIPYKIRAYNLSEKSVDADRLDRYRERQKALEKLRKCVENGDDFGDALWECIELYEGQKFRTSGRGRDHSGAVGFSYNLKVSSRTGEKTDEMIISSREAGKTITKSSVELAFRKALDEQERVGEMMGGQIMELDWIKAWREVEAEGKAEGISIFIADKREDNIPDEVIKEKLKKYYHLTDEEADGFLSMKDQVVAG